MLIVDDHSNDNTAPIVREDFPNFKLIQTPKNVGFAGACNHGLAQASTHYVGFLNNDAFPEKDWTEIMTQELDRDNQIAIVCSKVYQKNTRIIDSAGGIIEYPLGEAPPRGYFQEDKGQFNESTDVAYASGTAMIARTDLLRKIGGFDESYRNYHEETDLAWRLRLAGYKIRYIPQPSTQHIGSYTMGSNPAKRTFWQTRNRCTTNLKNLEMKHIFHWLFYELIYASLVASGGLIYPAHRNHALAYMRGILSFTGTLQSTLKKRREVQARRRVPDSEVLKLHRPGSLVTIIKRNHRYARTKNGHLFAV